MIKYIITGFFLLSIAVETHHAQNMNHPTTAQQASKRVRKLIDRSERIIHRKRPLPIKENIVTTNNWIGFAVPFVFDFDNPDKSKPVEISTAGHLAFLAKMVNEGYNFADINFILTANIDLDGREWTPIGTFGANNNDNSKRFCGVFDGNDHQITNLTITRGSDYVGLFGVCGTGSIIKNLHLVNSYIVGITSVGALVGELINGEIDACTVSGFVAASQEYVGGFVGVNGGKI